ncbi:hypothetical protein [Planctomyces sp. SH-PL62]|uniref:hypothetical protein n=1 Tax=Planctomyces sp. SH-PL62 TaxID=1636152 RepID=UPI00078B34CB|nr:hypothetical protein [Planctomyces sp. SH-PL62]AMV36330.1 hypothetical protein VT85_02735 [Planctomyces sp. SH-PL62]
MPLGPVRRRPRLAPASLILGLALALALAATGGCGGEDEPTEIPASPPPGKGLPRFADAPGLPARLTA